MTRRTWAALAATALALAAPAALAEYPDKPVQFIVPWPPGDLEDVLTRMIAEDFSAKYGVAAAVVNKPGGGGGPFPGAIEVATSPADGSVVGSFVIGVPVVGPDLGIPEIKSDTFEPVGIFLTYPFVLAVAGDAPYSTLAELAAYAKANELALGHFGAALTPTQVSFALAKELGFEWGSEAAFDALDCNTLASGDVDVINTTLQLILPCLKDVKIIASITGERIPLTPDVPTVAEVVPALKLALWNGLFVPKGTPQEVKDKIVAVARETVVSERAKRLAAETGAIVYWQDQAAAAEQIEKDKVAIAGLRKILGN